MRTQAEIEQYLEYMTLLREGWELDDDMKSDDLEQLNAILVALKIVLGVYPLPFTPAELVEMRAETAKARAANER